jgi:uncharacterized membrane protein
METTSTAPPAERRSAPLTIALGVIVLAVALLFALTSGWYSDWYAIFRVVHVLLAVFWVGGGLMITTFGLRAERSNNPGEIVGLARNAAFVGEKLFAPAGLVVFLMGIAMVINGDLGWSRFWIVAGLVGYLATFVTGVAVLSPLAKRIADTTERHGADHPETLALVQRILLIARVDVAVLLLVVADMTLKPFS